MIDKDLLNAIGVLAGGIGALIGAIAKLIEVLKQKEKATPRRRRKSSHR
ncbi:hypothetical protein [Eremococcus coleocola]|uniref:Uncharacterized protein n=1 Tax=Eremococcus coleocola ACS-139-V-Col8 TaxID=908337 RepID=E4KQ91_9LACT|nr:hypothetical protein [Eremococcus coleocola]EFR30873.1 hypothetical protein HMPREF9257_1691 [Eremococcus coleocola ACS-139-V-Col8]